MIITGRSGDLFLASAHGPAYEGDAHDHAPLSCQDCHGGAADNTFTTMDEAHAGMVDDPSALGAEVGCLRCHGEDSGLGVFTEPPRSACDGCHTEDVTNTAVSLHTTLAGYYTAIDTRCACDFADEMEANAAYRNGFAASCAGCHATCGQCHVSRPASVGGGFPQISSGYRSHRFFGKPDQDEQCTACHGSRVGNDFAGNLDDDEGVDITIEMDVHAARGDDCMDCHSREELHGDGNAYDHRYQVANMPRCEDCHDVTVTTGSGCADCHDGSPPSADNVAIPDRDVFHAHHSDASNAACTDCHHSGGPPGPQPADMQCQVCHSQPYNNCTNCHQLTLEGGYQIESRDVQLKIARNPMPAERDYEISLVRHVPIDPDTYASWGLTLDQAGYVSEPTWQYTSPHNIRTRTTQTTVEDGQSCAHSCHQSPDGPDGFLLRESDLYAPDGVTPLVDYDANIGIVIDDAFPAGDK